MILRPSAASVLGVVRAALRTSVTPAVSDHRALAELGMIDSILGTVIGRCIDEQRFIAEEVAAIVTLAEQVLRENGDDTVREGLTTLRRLGGAEGAAATDAGPPDAAARYEAASELLSRCLEVSMPAGGDLRTSAETVLRLRMQHQSDIHGVLAVHGR